MGSPEERQRDRLLHQLDGIESRLTEIGRLNGPTLLQRYTIVFTAGLIFGGILAWLIL